MKIGIKMDNTAQSAENTVNAALGVRTEEEIEACIEAQSEAEDIKHTVVRKDGKEYHILGTAHVSEKSRQEVEDLIVSVKPDTVCVELCEARRQALLDENRWKKLNIFEVIKNGKMLFLLGNLAVGAYQRRMGAQVGVKPGSELIKAAECAEANGASVELIDRDINVTLKRTWRNLGIFKKSMLLSAIVESLVSKDEAKSEDIEALKKDANLSAMMDELAKAMPEVHESLIDERDRYLVTKMKEAPGEKIVAVVGAGHVPGMMRYFDQDLDITEISKLPPPSKLWPVLKWLIPLILILSIAYGYSQQGAQSVYEMLMAWVLPNSIFAGIFAVIAGAKFLSIVSAIVLSPITSLTPVIGAGIVVGLIEAWLRKPTVEDCEKLSDIHTLRDFYGNPFTRTLIVAVFVTIGSALGAYVGIAWVVSLFALLS